MKLPLIGGLIETAVKYFDSKQKIKAAVDERKDELKRLDLQERLEKISKAQSSDITLDIESRKNAGWMDDASFAIFLMPAVLVFFPVAVPHVVAGFEALEAMPKWYQYALGGMLISVWGYRRLITPIVEMVVTKYVGR